MNVEQIQHVSIVVTDLDRATHFYGEVMGLPEIPKPRTFDFHVVWYAVGSGEAQIHLMPREAADAPSSRHFALQVDDAGAARERFRAAGVEIRETVEIPGADRFFVRDPDGNQIEIVEWKQPYSETMGAGVDASATGEDD